MVVEICADERTLAAIEATAEAVHTGASERVLPWPCGHDLPAVIDVAVAGAARRGGKFFTSWSW